MKSIKNCTLIGIEGVEKRLPQFLKAANICQHYMNFTDVKLLSPFTIHSGKWIRIKKTISDSGGLSDTFEKTISYLYSKA